MRCENKPLLQDDPRFFQDITSTAVEVGLIVTAASAAQKAADFILGKTQTEKEEA